MKKFFAAIFMASSFAALSASAQSVTISGTYLGGLKYEGDPGDSQYVGPIPSYAALSTPDSGLTGDAPTVFVTAANTSPTLTSLGSLGNFSASYTIYGTPTGSSGAATQPYWLLYLNDPNGGYIGLLSFGGPSLNGSSQIHVFYDYSDDPQSSNTYWGETLSQLDSTAYGTTTFGQLSVHEAGVEIGDWNNDGVIPASADLSSITVTSSSPIPEPSTWAMLVAGAGSLLVFRRRR